MPDDRDKAEVKRPRDLREEIEALVEHKDEPRSPEPAPGESPNDYIRRRMREGAP